MLEITLVQFAPAQGMEKSERSRQLSFLHRGVLMSVAGEANVERERSVISCTQTFFHSNHHLAKPLLSAGPKGPTGPKLGVLFH